MSLHSSLLEMALGNPEASKYNLVMDNDVVRICAEMAYNDVLMESFLEQNILDEGAFDTFKEKIKGIFDAVIGFIKSIWNKVVGFIKDLVRKIKGEKNSSSSSGSSSGGGSSKSSGEKSEKKEEPKVIFHDWDKISSSLDKIEDFPQLDDFLEEMMGADIKKFKNDKQLESWKADVEKKWNAPVFHGHNVSEIDKAMKEIYEELVSKNEISSPLSAKVLQKCLDKAVNDLEGVDDANKEFSSEIKEAEQMAKKCTIEDIAKSTGEKYSDKEAALMMDAVKYSANKMKDMSKNMAKFFITGKHILLDTIKNIKKEMKYAK